MKKIIEMMKKMSRKKNRETVITVDPCKDKIKVRCPCGKVRYYRALLIKYDIRGIDFFGFPGDDVIPEQAELVRMERA